MITPVESLSFDSAWLSSRLSTDVPKGTLASDVIAHCDRLALNVARACVRTVFAGLRVEIKPMNDEKAPGACFVNDASLGVAGRSASEFRLHLYLDDSEKRRLLREMGLSHRPAALADTIIGEGLAALHRLQMSWGPAAHIKLDVPPHRNMPAEAAEAYLERTLPVGVGLEYVMDESDPQEDRPDYCLAIRLPDGSKDLGEAYGLPDATRIAGYVEQHGESILDVLGITNRGKDGYAAAAKQLAQAFTALYALGNLGDNSREFTYTRPSPIAPGPSMG